MLPGTIVIPFSSVTKQGRDEIWELVERNYLNTQEGNKLPVTHCIKGTNGWEVDARLKDAMKERGVDCDYITYIDKPTFGSKELGELLAEYDNSDTEVYFCGFCTGICVISNVAIATTFCKDAEVFVIENACACVTPESHKTAIEAMKMIQANII